MGFSVRRGRGGVHVGRRPPVDARELAMEIGRRGRVLAATCAAATDPARIELETRPKCVEDAHGYAMYLSRATIPAIEPRSYKPQAWLNSISRRSKMARQGSRFV